MLAKFPLIIAQLQSKKLHLLNLFPLIKVFQLVPFIIPFGDLEKSKKLMLAASHFDVVSFSLGQQKVEMGRRSVYKTEEV